MRIPPRHDFRYPFAISSSSGQAEQASYEDHVAQMIRQFILTTPGERVCRPDFGGGLRSLIFAPNHVDLSSSAEMLIRHGLESYLGRHITVTKVAVSAPSDRSDSTVDVLIEYRLIETQSSRSLSVTFL